MKRVCLVSPGHLSTNPRVVKEAFALKAAGYRVHVIHGSFMPWGTANDQDIAKALDSTKAVCFGPTEASRMTYLRQTLVRRSAMFVASRFGSSDPWLSEEACSPASVDLARAATQHIADLYIAHYVAALPAAARAAKHHGALYAFDAEDFHLGDLPDTPENALEKRIIQSIENRRLPGATFVNAAAPMIAEAYAETYAIPLPTTILNVFPLRNAPLSATPKGSAEPGPGVYWFSQTIGPGRGLETAIEAIGRAESCPHLYLRGTPARGYVERLRTIAQRVGVVERLHILPPVPPEKLERLGSAYDLGYSGETGFSMNNSKALGNKVFSYILSGIPTVATDIPAHCRLARDLDSAMEIFPVGDPSALATAIDNLLLNPERLAAARAHAWRIGQERYNWEAEAPRFLAQVASAFTHIGCRE